MEDARDYCFGASSSTTWGILIGIFIILMGVTSLLGDVYEWASWDRLWPVFVIGIGLLILANALRRR